LGADYRLRDNLVLGAAVGYTTTTNDIDRDGGELDVDGGSVSLYGTWFHERGFYADAIASYGHNDYDQERTVRYAIPDATVSQTATAGYDGDQWSVALGTGYEISRGALTAAPTLQLEYLSLEVDGFRERVSDPDAPGRGLAVSIDDQDTDSLTLRLGGRASYSISLPWGVLVPQASAEWVHEFDDDARQVAGRFVSAAASDPGFVLATDDPDRDYFVIGAGASAVFARGVSAFAYYEGLAGHRELDNHSVTVGLRWEF
ncbi:MAG: autotransporter outer membrane beta-barrel domain-containing protein, partial [Pseudomonadota bacterium]|nr:autotransporter outer membrane beta-barrel domain-containing protein [Pseudomonadota bacterium]